MHEAVLDALDGGGALFFRALADRVVAGHGPAGDPGAARAAGDGRAPIARRWPRDLGPGLGRRLTNDTLAPLRTVLARPALPGRRRGR